MSVLLDFTACRMSDTGELCITPKNKPMALRFVLQHDAKKTYTCEIKEFRAKRSLDANAYAWVLIDKLAAAMHMGKTEVYRNAVKDIGGNSVQYHVREDAVKPFIRAWSSQGLGWPVDVLESTKQGYKWLICHYGSSSYDTSTMKRLIDNLAQDCEALGIETKTPRELALMMDAWKPCE